MIGNLHVYEDENGNLHIITEEDKEKVFLIKNGWQFNFSYYMAYKNLKGLLDVNENVFYQCFMDFKLAPDWKIAYKIEEYNLNKSNSFKIDESGNITPNKLIKLNIKDIQERINKHMISSLNCWD